MPSLEKGSVDPNQLNEGGGTDGSLNPREFFWDSVILYLVSVILFLTAFDAISEYIRGTGVACVDTNGDPANDYINVFCGGSLPDTEFFPAFLFVHGLAVAIPHLLWFTTFGGQVDYFFSVVKKLDQSKDRSTGKYSLDSVDIVRRLENSFTTYGRNYMYYLYIGKFFLQLIFALAALVLSVIYFTDFNVVFQCPRDANDTNSSSFPQLEPVTCVFTSLKLLYWIKIVDVVLLALIILCIFWGFLFCVSGHPTELKPEQPALFSFQSGMHPDMYLSKCWYCPGRLISWCCVRLYLPIFTSPMIDTDLDFLLLKLFRTNGGFGKVFKDIQIELHIQELTEQDKLGGKLFKFKWNSNKFKDIDVPDSGLGWTFKSFEGTEDKPRDVYSDENKRTLTNAKLTVPSSVRGAVLGLSTCSNGGGAIAISFNTAGYGLALSRFFIRTATIVFTDFVKETSKKGDVDEGSSGNIAGPRAIDKLVDMDSDSATQLSITMPENILVSDISIVQEVLPKLTPIWQEDEDDEPKDYVKTSFIVVGPMTKSQSTTINLFLTKLCEGESYLEKGCIIVTLKPTRVAGKSTREKYSGLKKPPSRCAAVGLSLNPQGEKVDWPHTFGTIAVDNKEPSSDSAHPERSADGFHLVETGVDRTESPNCPQQVHLQCGDVPTEFEVSSYIYNMEMNPQQCRQPLEAWSPEVPKST